MDAFILPIILKKILSGKDVYQHNFRERGLVRTIGTELPAEKEGKKQSEKNSNRYIKEKEV
jgi:hypothetical protein